MSRRYFSHFFLFSSFASFVFLASSQTSSSSFNFSFISPSNFSLPTRITRQPFSLLFFVFFDSFFPSFSSWNFSTGANLRFDLFSLTNKQQLKILLLLIRYKYMRDDYTPRQALVRNEKDELVWALWLPLMCVWEVRMGNRKRCFWIYLWMMVSRLFFIFWRRHTQSQMTELTLDVSSGHGWVCGSESKATFYRSTAALTEPNMCDCVRAWKTNKLNNH